MRKTVLISSHILTELGEICDSAAIIEAGRILAYGTIQEIEQQQRSVSGQTTSRTLLARIASPDDLDGQTDRLEKWLLEQPNVSRVQCATGRATFDYEGDDEGQQNLLKKIIDDGIPVIEFHGKSQSLEDAFMNITQGITQ
jgi:ABC-2 type transport system ATP-binding protein